MGLSIPLSVDTMSGYFVISTVTALFGFFSLACMFSLWSKDVHVVWLLSSFFLVILFTLCTFFAP